MLYRPIRLSKLDWRDRDFIYGASRITLGQKADGAEAREYLISKRGIDVESIARFRLGFVPFSVQSDPSRSFAGRLVLPIFDAYDDLIAISVRPIRDDAEVDQKYWNESFSKGDHLYGLNLAKYSISAWNFAIVVEGQFDVLKMHAHGLTNTVGIMGGAFTPIQAIALKRWTPNIVFIMDGDKAGRKHTDQIRDMMEIFKEIQSGTNLRRESRLRSAFVTLSDEFDPASYLARNGGRSMRRLIEVEIDTTNMRVSKQWIP